MRGLIENSDIGIDFSDRILNRQKAVFATIPEDQQDKTIQALKFFSRFHQENGFSGREQLELSSPSDYPSSDHQAFYLSTNQYASLSDNINSDNDCSSIHIPEIFDITKYIFPLRRLRRSTRRRQLKGHKSKINQQSNLTHNPSDSLGAGRDSPAFSIPITSSDSPTTKPAPSSSNQVPSTHFTHASITSLMTPPKQSGATPLFANHWRSTCSICQHPSSSFLWQVCSWSFFLRCTNQLYCRPFHTHSTSRSSWRRSIGVHQAISTSTAWLRSVLSFLSLTFSISCSLN